MSRIDELIAEHCPEGVEFLRLEELLDYGQPGKYLVKSTAYDPSFETPVLTAGQTFILGYTDETEGIYHASEELPVIIFDDFTTAFKWVDFNFKAKSSAMKMITPKPGVNLRYVWFAMQTISYAPQDHARQWIGTYSQFRIPVPPLEVQSAIVEILDTFSKLEAELEAELEARKQQYEHYRAELLVVPNDSNWSTLGELCAIETGKLNANAASEDGEYAFFTTAQEISRIDSYRWDTEALLVAGNANVGDVKHFVGKFEAYQRTYVLTKFSDRVDVKFLFYVLKNGLQRYLEGRTNSAAMTYIVLGTLRDLPVALLSLDEQRRIVAILDKFDALVNDLSIGLPAELAARRQQYEYYRDKLLTFKELEVAV